jgi:hypothetical protein
VGGMFENMPLVLLHHTGARSGTAYTIRWPTCATATAT